MFSVISNLPETTALLIEDPRSLREYWVMQMQITNLIQMIENPLGDVYQCNVLAHRIVSKTMEHPEGDGRTGRF